MRPEEWRIGSSWIWPETGELMTKEQLRRFREADVACVETGVRWDWVTPKYSAHAERLTAVIGAFQDAGLTVWSVHVPGGRTIDLSHPDHADAGIELVSRQMEVCARMGVDKVVVHPSFEPIEDADRPARLARCAESMKKLSRPDVRLAIENLPRTCLCNEAGEMRELLASVRGYAYACVDVNHAHRNNIVDMLSAAGDQLITLHISDDDSRDEKHWYPGEGVLNWNDILGTLEQMGYEGTFLYELEEKYADPMKIRRNFDKLVEAYRAAKE